MGVIRRPRMLVLRDGESTAKSAVPEWLLDDYVDGYLRWREECAAVRRGYRVWHIAPRRDRRLAFAAYVAALDREEKAALVLSEHVERILQHVNTARTRASERFEMRRSRAALLGRRSRRWPDQGL